MQSVSGPGLVLRRARHQEDDVRITLFMRELGKLMVLSKGGQLMRSKLKVFQEPFTEADFQVSLPDHGVYARLTGGRLITAHSHLTQEMPSFEYAARCCEVVDVLLPHRAPSPAVFDILRSAFQSMKTPGVAPLVWIRFNVHLLLELGHGDVSDELSAVFGGEDVLNGDPLTVVRGLDPHRYRSGLKFIDSRLEQILPWRLKSDMAS